MLHQYVEYVYKALPTPPSVGVLPCREPPQTLSLLLANRHGRFEIADFHYETSHAAKRRGDSSPRPEQARPHTYMWSIYAVAGLVLLAVALYKLWQRSSSPQYARIVGGTPEGPGLSVATYRDIGRDTPGSSVVWCGVVYLLRRNPLGPPHQHTRLDFMAGRLGPRVGGRAGGSAACGTATGSASDPRA